MTKIATVLVFASMLPVVAHAVGIDDWCTRAEQAGDVEPSSGCAGYVGLQAEVASAAAPCWEGISDDQPYEQWLAQRQQCEDQAHWQVCGRSRCY